MATGTQSDDSILAAARAGDTAAIEALLERYQQRVFGFGLRMCGDTEDAKDVLQETLLAAARTIGAFRGASSVSTWLYTIARSFCIKKRRRSQFAPREEISSDKALRDLPATTPGPEEMAARNEVKRALVEALGALEPSAREVLVLRDIEGLTAQEVAEVTGSSVDAVKSRLHRARGSLRERMAQTLGDVDVTPTSTCPDVIAAFSQDLEGDLNPKICAELQQHIEACAACRGACDSLKRTLAVCSSLPPDPVPPMDS